MKTIKERQLENSGHYDRMRRLAAAAESIVPDGTWETVNRRNEMMRQYHVQCSAHGSLGYPPEWRSGRVF